MDRQYRLLVFVFAWSHYAVMLGGHLQSAEPSDTKAASGGVVRPRVLLLSDEVAWQRLGIAPRDRNKRLPAWARALTTALPKTTAAMLRLDHLHRVQSPLDARLRARIRWVAAHANRSTYGQNYALSDFAQAGADESQMRALVNGQPAGDPGDVATLQFARKLTLAASTVTDEEVAALIQQHGASTVVAVVLLVAYANFQDRLLLSLGLDDEDHPALPAVAVQALQPRAGKPYQAPRRTLPEKLASQSVHRASQAEDWSSFNFAQLQQQLEFQRARPPRIKMPADDPSGKESESRAVHRRASRVTWTRVCLGYQPQLAAAWFACMGSFHRESRQDRVFEESMFWVITRSVDCFY